MFSFQPRYIIRSAILKDDHAVSIGYPQILIKFAIAQIQIDRDVNIRGRFPVGKHLRRQLSALSSFTDRQLFRSHRNRIGSSVRIELSTDRLKSRLRMTVDRNCFFILKRVVFRSTASRTEDSTHGQYRRIRIDFSRSIGNFFHSTSFTS